MPNWGYFLLVVYYAIPRNVPKDCFVISRVVRCKSKLKFLQDYSRYQFLYLYLQHFHTYIHTLLTSWQIIKGHNKIYFRDLHVLIVETWRWVLFGESLHRSMLLKGTYNLILTSKEPPQTIVPNILVSWYPEWVNCKGFFGT